MCIAYVTIPGNTYKNRNFKAGNWGKATTR